MTENAIVPSGRPDGGTPESTLAPLHERDSIEQRALAAVKTLANIVLTLRSDVLKDGIDFGVIPDTGDKATLLLPGMEKLMRALNAVPEYLERCVIRDYAKPLFHYEYECRLVDAQTGLAIPGGHGLGLCTSAESAFAWRWVKRHEIPAQLDPTSLVVRAGSISEFTCAVEKAETSGKYAKPAAYWQLFKTAIEDGTAREVQRKTKTGATMPAWEIDTTVYRVPNPDICDQLNAILKRAKKRALGDAIKGAANISEFFTVDLEDFARFDDSIEGHFTIAETGNRTAPLPQATPPGQPEPAAGWANGERIRFILGKVRETIPDITDSEILRLTNLASLDDLDAWNQYATSGQAAKDKLIAAWQAAQKPASPKASKTKPAGKAETKDNIGDWSIQKIGEIEAYCANWYDFLTRAPYTGHDMLTTLKRAGWGTFANSNAAKAAIRKAMLDKEPPTPMIATQIIYHPDGKPANYSELRTPNNLVIGCFGLTDQLKKAGYLWEA
jgi:hypothetical protein